MSLVDTKEVFPKKHMLQILQSEAVLLILQVNLPPDWTFKVIKIDSLNTILLIHKLPNLSKIIIKKTEEIEP
jgi:hypothetical protein